MIEELWKDIEGYKGLYKISNIGRVRSKERYNLRGKLIKSKIRKPFINNNGYLRVNLSKKNLTKNYSLHRLVALHFISNPDNKEQVNHIDGNKQNNCINNLEWVTASENMKHSYDIGIRTTDVPIKGNTKKICVWNKKGLHTFNSIKEASEQMGLSYHILKDISRNRRKSKMIDNYNITIIKSL